MFLALREIRRAKIRFGLLVAAVGLLVLLILGQQAIQNGLITSFVGGIERQSAPVLVYSVDGQRTFQGSVITPDLELAVRKVDGVEEAGRIGQGTFTVRVAGQDGDSDAAILGYGRPGLGAPDSLSAGRLPSRPGEAVGSSAGFDLGDRVEVLPAGAPTGERTPITVVGIADRAQILVTPTLFVAWPDYVTAVRSVNPDATQVLPSALGVRPVAGLSPEALAGRINRADPDADALTRTEAAEKTPGVAEVRSSFQVIFLLFGLVVPLTTGLFFLIVTLQKARSLTLLRAIGARRAVLVRSLMLQVSLVVGAGLALGIAAYVPLTQLTLGDVALSFDLAAVVFWSVLFMALGLLSALLAARRVMAIDPIEATVSEGSV